MNIRYVDNILFQKKEFPEIYRSYTENRDGALVNVYSKTNPKGIYIITEEDTDLLQLISELFYVRIDCRKLCHTCILLYNVDFHIAEVEGKEGVLEIGISHPFLNDVFPVVIGNFLADEFLKQASCFYTYRTQPLKQLQNLRIRNYFDYEFASNNLNAITELRECIRAYEKKYEFNIKAGESGKTSVFERIKVAEKVSMDIVKVISDDWNMREEDIIQRCVDKTFSLFTVEAKEIVGNALQNGFFEHNFVCIEKYFDCSERTKNRIRSYFKKRIQPILQKLRANFEGYAYLHNSLSNTDEIVELDDYIQEELQMLRRELEDN